MQPHNSKAEQAILSAMLLNPGIIPSVGRELREEDFYQEKNRVVFVGLCELGSAADPVTLTEHLKKRDELKIIDGGRYLFDIEGAVSTSAAWEHHAKIIKSLSIRRKIIAQCQATMAACQKPHTGTDEIL